MAVSEAKGLVVFFIKRQRRNGLNIDQAIYREATKCGVPQSEIHSLWYRARHTVSAAVLENLRQRYESIYEASRRRLQREIELKKLLAEKLDPDIAQPLDSEIERIGLLYPSVDEEPKNH